MAYNWLTDVPRNFKEAIDWLIALKGTDGVNNLKAMGTAIHAILANKPAGFTKVPALEDVKLITKEFLEKDNIKDLSPASDMLQRFSKPMIKSNSYAKKFNFEESDYVNVISTRAMKPEDIAHDITELVYGCAKFLEEIKTPDKYNSAYSPETNWEASCARNPQACAVVFVGIAPMLFVGLRSLQFASYSDGFNWLRFNRMKVSMVDVLEAMGYKKSELPLIKNGSNVFNALKNVSSRMLSTLYDLSGFWAFY
ncbi:hypothetical protein BBBOND_0208650 [Babesia bigemina]|uniref:Uncharacterized protein n=1 Tax=Babesia bigemina TaxID=5866 RepID=A0A061D4T1_BABBI|nr:hypothetical protein BBBOND_0208650 [Babesia bigemina]CDR95711.1 hypothetical protein BBBOND_0208650 [Babesia bigemina]|eukprot:XP_012767897.1 hypothetical protein BBBOND_0208650 [Babesia bigemina]